jgi:membrane-bound serine protease (ClpP class)
VQRLSGWVLTRLLAVLLFSVLSASNLGTAVQAQQTDDSGRPVIQIQVDGPLTPALVRYIERALDRASEVDAEVVILQLDTPGGQVDLMQDIVTLLRESQTPVAVFVAPRGAAAWSAGTVIVLAGHASAMAPETGIGAASPVGMDTELPETAEKKAKAAVLSLVRDLAAARGPKVVDWAIAAVEDATAASASEAYALGIVDFIADDVDDLLQKLNGFEVEVRGEPRVLHTAGARVEIFSKSLIEQILHVIVNPTIVLTLLAVGVQAILIEISNPGGWVAGFIGVVCIALAVYGLGVMPTNGLGLILIVLAIGLFVMEVKAPTHGALTAAGVASMIAGALVLFNTEEAAQYARISFPVVVTIALCFAATFVFIMTKALQAQRPGPRTGVEGLVGASAEARFELNPEGKVFLEGEYWNAIAEDGPIHSGEQVKVVAVEGFRLRVRRNQDTQHTAVDPE